MHEIELTADELVARLLQLSATETVCILDSCGVGHLGSHLLLAAIRPVESMQLSDDDPESTMAILNKKLSGDLVGFFTLSYDFGVKLSQIPSAKSLISEEPDVFLALFDALIVHDYTSGRTYISNSAGGLDGLLSRTPENDDADHPPTMTHAASDFSADDYKASIETIREHIRSGDTYQTNLTQQITCSLPKGLDATTVFRRLRGDHPAPFAAFLRRQESTVVSASPERFFRVDRDGFIEASPIKGTRPRGRDRVEDYALRTELKSSEKDHAENTMIVDLMRNDLGRVCEYGSVRVEKLCDIEEHPTLFHLVSTVRGKLCNGLGFSQVLRALFPCGSITGAPKISTMEIIDEIERSPRGLSMGAIGVYIPQSWNLAPVSSDTVFDLSVAIRTMVIRDGDAVFNVGGGIVIDSDPAKEFDESLLKAKALLNALNAAIES